MRACRLLQRRLWQDVAKIPLATQSPKDLSWNTTGINWDGFPYPPDATEKSMKAMLDYEPEKGDVVIATYPKSGTTWMLWITHQLATKGHEDFEMFHKQHPFIELDTTKWPIHASMDAAPRPRMIKTHGPLRHLPKDSKIIFIVRDPRQVVVDFYQHSLFTNQLADGGEPQFSSFFDRWIDGKLFYGDWFEQTQEFVLAQDDPNVLFLYFEDMCKDLKPVVKQVADFMEVDASDALLDKVMPRFDFKYMQAKPNCFDFTLLYPTRKKDGQFFGSVKKDNLFNDEQLARLRTKFNEFFPNNSLKYDL